MKDEQIRYGYLSLIKKHYSMLSKSEKKIADYLMNNYNESGHLNTDLSEMTVSDFAGRTQTSSATVIRFCKTIGFNGFSELKYYAVRGVLNPSENYVSIEKSDPISIVRQKISNFNKYAIDDTNDLLDDNVLKIAVKRLLAAKSILILGEGGSGCAARAAQIEFMQIGLNCAFHEDTFLQMLFAGQMTKHDVILAISHSGRASNTIDAMKCAFEKDTFVISITSVHNSPMTKYSNATLYISSMERDYFSNTAAARICELNTVSILHSAIVQVLHENNPNQDQLVNELYEIKRVSNHNRNAAKSSS